MLQLLPDVPAGKLAIADVAVANRDEVLQLERAGFDAVLIPNGSRPRARRNQPARRLTRRELPRCGSFGVGGRRRGAALRRLRRRLGDSTSTEAAGSSRRSRRSARSSPRRRRASPAASWSRSRTRPRSRPPRRRRRPTDDVDGIKCEHNAKLVFHVHTHVTVFVNGEQRTIPAGVGIDPPIGPDNYRASPIGPQFGEAPGQCLTWLSTRYADGLIHVESSEQRSFTLGDFFAVWGQPLSKTELGPEQGDVTAIVTARPGQATRPTSRSARTRRSS